MGKNAGKANKVNTQWESILNHPARRPVSSEEIDEIFSKQLGEVS